MNTSNDDKDASEHSKEIRIVVNGRPKVVSGPTISFIDIVSLAFENPATTGNTVYTVTYKKGPEHKPEGTMVDGDTVKVKSGMIFNVTATDKS